MMERTEETRKKIQSTLDVSDVADAYIIHLMHRRLEDKSLAYFRLYEIQQKYLEVFREIMEAQLDYYKRTNRVDSALNIGEQIPLQSFPFVFSHTLRHDRKRINESWVDIATKVVNLHQARDYGIFNALDVLNHTVHNEGGYILTKLDGWMQLYRVIQTKFGDITKASEELLSYGSREIRALYRQVMV